MARRRTTCRDWCSPRAFDGSFAAVIQYSGTKEMVEMVDTNWTIHGREFVNCNCSYGCPCQFNGLPTHGHCRAVAGMEIEQGHHGGTKLDGLKFVAIFRWPGAIHEGKGEG